MEIGLHRHAVTDRHTINSRSDGDHFGTQLMAQNAWVLEEGLATAESVQVGTTDPHTVDAEQGIPRAGFTGSVGIGTIEAARFGQDEGFHGSLIGLQERLKDFAQERWRLAEHLQVLVVGG